MLGCEITYINYEDNSELTRLIEVDMMGWCDDESDGFVVAIKRAIKETPEGYFFSKLEYIYS